jgi:molecular chaperone Hsp33
MGDYLVRAQGYNGQVRAFAVRSTDLIEEVRKRLDTWPTATAALGRALSAGAMMGAMLKGDDRLTIQINGGGPIGKIVVDANAHGEVRGYVNHPHVHFPPNNQGKLDVARAVGKDGYLHVVKDLGLKEPYRGSSPIISGELGEDFTYYFATSEQTPSAVGLGVIVSPDNSVQAAGGFILQLLPGAEEEVIGRLEHQLATIRPVSQMVQSGLSPEEMLAEVLGETPIILSSMDVHFRCGCSLDRARSALASLGRGELEDILEKGEEPEIECHFCREKYRVPLLDIEELLKPNAEGIREDEQK